MSDFVTPILFWLLAGSLVWSFYTATGLATRGALLVHRAHGVDVSWSLRILVALVIVLNWPAFAFLAARSVIRAFAHGFDKGWRA